MPSGGGEVGVHQRQGLGANPSTTRRTASGSASDSMAVTVSAASAAERAR